MDVSEAPSADGGQDLIGRLPDYGLAAWRLAVRILGSEGWAEDIVQQGYLEAIRRIRNGMPPPDEPKAWFLGVVMLVAKNQLRSEAHRRKREVAVRSQVSDPRPESGVSPELVKALRRAIEQVDERFRLPVLLCHEEGMTQREAALVLGIPERTVSKYVRAGLDQLRSLLAKTGHPAAPLAVMIGGLGHMAPAMPVSLMAAIQQTVSGGITAKALAGAALKISARLSAKKAAGLALGWKAAAVVGVVVVGAVVTPMVYNAVSGKPAAVVQPADDFDLAAAAAKCRTVADLRALQPRIRAASEKMLADPDFDPDRVIGLEFADVAARQARDGWEVPAATVAIRLALCPLQSAPPDPGFDSEWKSRFARTCRLRHEGRHREALESWAETPVPGNEILLAFWLAFLDDREAGTAYRQSLNRSPVVDSSVLRSLAGLEMGAAQNQHAPAIRLTALWIVRRASEDLPEDSAVRQELVRYLSRKLSQLYPPELFSGSDAVKLSENLVAEGESAVKQITDHLNLVLEGDRR